MAQIKKYRHRVGILLFIVLVAGLSGIGVYASYQPTGWWWAAIGGYALLLWASSMLMLKGTPHKLALVFMVWLQGLVHYLLLLPWIGEFVGASAWIALAVIQSLYSLIFGWGLMIILSSYRTGKNHRAGRVQGLLSIGVSILIASWFGAVETLRSSFPFGGFPWGRIAWGQVGGPLAGVIRLGGPVSVSTVVIILAALCGFFIFHFHRTKSINWSVGASALLLILGAGLYTVTISSDGSQTDTLRVAAVQGNVPRMGLDFNAQQMAVLRNHLNQSRLLVGAEPRPDVVIWPENSSDINPFRNDFAYEAIDELVQDLEVPTLVGTLTRDEEGDKNTVVAWDPQKGPGERHDKKILQPFGEYMPFRDLLRRVNSAVDQAGNFKPGHGTGVVHVEGKSSEDYAIGVATCYEISFDRAPREAVLNGAEILSSPTNNATFGFTDMTYQQLAMSRMRALEYDRSVVVAATSGVSAIIMPNSEVIEQSGIFRPAVLQAEVPLRDTITLSARLGTQISVIITTLGVFSVFLSLLCPLLWQASKKRRKIRRKNRVDD